MKWTMGRRHRAGELLAKFAETTYWMVVAAPFVASKPLGAVLWTAMAVLFVGWVTGSILLTGRRYRWKG